MKVQSHAVSLVLGSRVADLRFRPRRTAGARELVRKARDQPAVSRGGGAPPGHHGRDRQGPEAAVREALEVTTGSGARGWAVLGLVQCRQGQLDDATESVGKALGTNPRQPYALLASALISLDSGKQDAALESWRQMTKSYPNPIPGHPYLETLKSELRERMSLTQDVPRSKAEAKNAAQPDNPPLGRVGPDRKPVQASGPTRQDPRHRPRQPRARTDEAVDQQLTDPADGRFPHRRLRRSER